VFRALAAVVLPVMGAMSSIRVENPEKVPASGAFVLAPNHYSEIDPIVIGIAMWRIGRMPHYLAKSALFRVPVVGALLRASGQIPVDRAGVTRAGDPLVAARTMVDDGSGVIIYPEGSLTREPDLWPMRGKSGAVRMALTAGVPIIPVAHWGTQTLLPRYAKRLRLFPRARITVRFGDPVDLSPWADGPLDARSITAATDAVMVAITALLADLRGEAPPAERWDPSKNDQQATGRF
jgi:1-acyl-sn-glycerol-3-phosphate acyltransferase